MQSRNIHVLFGALKMFSVTLKLVRLEEKRINNKLTMKHGAVIHDRCACNNMYFTGVIASNCTVYLVRREKNRKQVSAPRLALHTFVPMGSMSSNSEEEYTNVTTAFEASACIKFFRDIIEVFDCNFDNSYLGLMGEKVTTNRKVGNSIWKLYAESFSHKLDLGVRYLLNRHHDFLEHIVICL